MQDVSRLQLLSEYAPRAGKQDELMLPNGGIRPVWRDFIEHLSRFTPDDLTTRFARGNQYLRDAGVLFRHYDDTVSSERDWPLSHIPVVIDGSEWEEISTGLVQRADLLETVVQDVYGNNELVAAGHLPATLLTQNPAWLRPMVGVSPAGGNFLNFLAFEIGRGPDGKWWVISDMIEAPSGAGFAIENRVAMSRVFPNFFANAKIHRLATFFQEFQKSLFDYRGNSKGQIAVLSPGPMNDSYFEHAYLARYLGLLLVEGEDLTVQNGQAMVRTVSGPMPLSMLWRRISGPQCDPLEFNADSQIGTPGLLEAVRRRNLSVVNALGAGVLETRALMAFLPRISREVLGQPLRIPNVATWWCGQPGEQTHVIENRAKMMIGSAFSTTPLISDPHGIILAEDPNFRQDEGVTELLRTKGRELVGQEAVTLSTTPVWEDGHLVARPMCLRVFLGRTSDGWRVMPGGYARVSAGTDTKVFAMQRGGKVADVWVASDRPVEKASLLAVARESHANQSLSRALPSRAADNLYWLGRYVERAELNMRLFRAYYGRVRDGAPENSPLLSFMRATLLGGAKADAAVLARRFEAPLERALHAAGKVGDRFSPDGMMALKELDQTASRLRDMDIPLDEKPRDISLLLRQITGFAGLVHENMFRSLGWRFLSLGFSLERATNMCYLLPALVSADAPDGALDLALEIGDSTISHRARYSVTASPRSVLDLLALDERNPRAIHYHISRARSHVSELPGNSRDHAMTDVARKALQLETSLAVETSETFEPDSLHTLESELRDFSELISRAHLV
ncbi:hypothetical protein GO499_10110 [Algicella marina]|uniref:Uncharacterized protein n=2 Tax=Algicella marina TaxID=2683284 RepID=A0A6P1T9P7_9RHOB|nr:hypothetical protein GO499_10110 [Algicella marina]